MATEQVQLPRNDSNLQTTLGNGVYPGNEHFYPRPLLSDEKRVLEIQPATYEALVSCCLHVVGPKRSVIKYIALSYCWGVANDFKTIVLNGSEGYAVTDHLYQGLRRLRHHRAPRFVWIDAICINQADDVEKSHQVRKMGSIYADAELTIIWLGEMDASQPTCSRDHWGVCTEPCGVSFIGRGQPDALQPIREKLEQDEERSCQQAHLMDVWWKRLWVIQEFTASEHPPNVLIGSHAITWKMFSVWGIFSGTEQYEKRPSQLRVFDRLWVRSARLDLSWLLRHTVHHFACKDPRDRIFALLNLVSDRGQPLSVDYSSSVELVFAEAAVYLAKTRGNVNFMIDMTRRLRVGSQMTWIPDCSRSHWRTYSRRGDLYAACRFHPSVRIELQQECVPSSHTVTVEDQESGCSCLNEVRLRLRCLPFDAITTKVDMRALPNLPDSRAQYAIDQRRSYLGYSKHALTLWVNSLMPFGRHYKDGREELHTLRKLIDALNLDYHRKSKWDLDRRPNIGYLILSFLYDEGELMKLRQRLKKAPERRSRSDWGGNEVGDGRSIEGERLLHSRGIFTASKDRLGELEKERIESKARELSESLGFVSNKVVQDDFEIALQYEDLFLKEVHFGKRSSRVFFSTEDGFVGLGPGDLQPGDQIVVPFESSRPWIPANHGDHHVLIGDAVIPGIMSGGLQTLYEDGLAGEADYILR